MSAPVGCAISESPPPIHVIDCSSLVYLHRSARLYPTCHLRHNISRVALIFDPLSDTVPMTSLIGGKAFALWQLAQAGFRVPAWIAVTVDTTSADLDSPRFADELARILQQRGLADSALAVRSSATVEDGATHSFAGQFESVLGVLQPGVIDAIRHVRDSAESYRVRHYSASATDGAGIGMAVIIQQLVDAEASGVAFGADPVSGDTDTIVISATLGLGEKLVQGDVDADTFTWKNGKLAVELAAKTTSLHRSPSGGTVESPVPVQKQRLPAIDDDQIAALVDAVQRLDAHFGHPQDVEWAVADGLLHILQSRPITTLPAAADTARATESQPAPPPEGKRVVWDNSNIVESYSGVTTPLTFSFVSDVYTQVYQEFCRMFGVAEQTLAENRSVFTMLGLIDGRIYYNLLNWHRLLALLPGYRINAGFMEQMMGVRERLEETPSIIPPRSNPYIRLAGSLFRLVANLFTLRGSIRDFHALVDAELLPLVSRDMHSMTGIELVDIYRRLQTQLLQRWRVPILNDFYTMIFHGLLNSSVKALDMQSQASSNDLLAGSGGIVSVEPMRLLRQIATAVLQDARLLKDLRSADDITALALLEAHPVASAPTGEYIARFGDRTAGELKLETITARQRPELILGQLRAYIDSPERAISDLPDPAAVAERALMKQLSSHPLSRLKLRLLLRQTRVRVRERENLRFERTRVFGVVRRIFLALGGHLHRTGMIDDARDVFLLTKEEIFSIVDGTNVTVSARELVDLRRREQQEVLRLDPADRFETFGFPATNPPSTRARVNATQDGTTLKGTAACRGKITARVRIVLDPLDPGELAGRIMVAERTDPGWGPLFPLAAGLLVERGSLLSHSAIVAREMGIPAIVSIPGLLQTLRDGEMVEMDGSTGEIRRLEPVVTQPLDTPSNEVSA